jgi:hypothetical protein
MWRESTIPPCEELVDNNGVAPAGFPVNAEDLRHLNNALLQAYGLGVQGNLAQKRNMLANFIGIVLV